MNQKEQVMKEQNRNIDEQNKQDKQTDIKNNNASVIDGIIESPTQNVRSRRSSLNMGNTGTNISYEGATAPGAGGSVGTGESSGKSATGATIHTPDSTEEGRIEHPTNKGK